MSSLALIAILTLATLPAALGSISTDDGTEPGSSDGDRRGKTYNWREYHNFQPAPPLRSYVIYDGDAGRVSTGNRPQVSSTRTWHTAFNQRQEPAESQSQSVYSNLIQIYDTPRKHYGPQDGKASFEPNRVYQSYPRYEVVYPYESQRTQYYDEKLPDRFPKPFSPNKDFEIRDPAPGEYPRRDYGLYRPQTVHYGQDDRASRKEQCNYIRLNDKGFPVGNEMCGRSVSDILLAPEYSTTGELVLEHRKRYRGVNHREKRSADNCCGYGFYRSPDFGYDGRPSYNDNHEDYGQETSNNNRGLTSYLANRGRGSSEDDESNEDDSNRNQGYDRSQSNSGGKRQHQNRNHRPQNSSNNRSRNNHRNYGNDDDSGYSSFNRNNGNNYGYVRNEEPNRYFNDGFRNIGGGSFGSYSPYGRYNK